MESMDTFEAAFTHADMDKNEVARRAIRLIQLSTDMFSAICDNADDTPTEVIEAANDWYSYLTEVASPGE